MNCFILDTDGTQRPWGICGAGPMDASSNGLGTAARLGEAVENDLARMMPAPVGLFERAPRGLDGIALTRHVGNQLP